MLRLGGNRLDDRAVQLRAELVYVDLSSFLGIDIALVQCDYHGDAQFQKLRCEEKRSGKVGGVYDIYYCIRVLITNEFGRDGFLRCERRHGVSAGKVHCCDLHRSSELLFQRSLFLAYGNAGPVTYTFTHACQRIKHGRLSAVGIAGKRNSHIKTPL